MLHLNLISKDIPQVIFTLWKYKYIEFLKMNIARSLEFVGHFLLDG